MPLWKTEDEAKKMWCPHVGEQRYGRQDELCMVSKCMAWRWAKTHIEDDEGNLTASSTNTYGYCGLAGVPTYD